MNKMTPDLWAAIIGSIARIGIDATLIIMERMSQASTLQEALAAVRAAKEKSLQQYKDEAAQP